VIFDNSELKISAITFLNIFIWNFMQLFSIQKQNAFLLQSFINLWCFEANLKYEINDSCFILLHKFDVKSDSSYSLQIFFKLQKWEIFFWITILSIKKNILFAYNIPGIIDESFSESPLSVSSQVRNSVQYFYFYPIFYSHLLLNSFIQNVNSWIWTEFYIFQ
jgi:hypothetical protein